MNTAFEIIGLPVKIFHKYKPWYREDVDKKEKKLQFRIRGFKQGNQLDDSVFTGRDIKPFLEEKGLNSPEYTLMCVPPSNEEKYFKRLKWFMNYCCEQCNLSNGFSLITYKGERPSIHYNGMNAATSIPYSDFIEVSPEIKGKRIILFDDIITRGISFNLYALFLQSHGAIIEQGIVLAETMLRSER